MEELARIVAQSMARHGCDAAIDHRRLVWSPWVRCEWSADLLLVPSTAGILALAEDIGALGPQSGSERTDSAPFRPAFGLGGEAVDASTEEPGPVRPLPAAGDQRPVPRVLALFEIAETDDLGAALVRLFSPQSGYRDRLRSGRCFARFTPVGDRDQRQAAATALRDWLTRPADIAAPSTATPTTATVKTATVSTEPANMAVDASAPSDAVSVTSAA